MVRFIIYARLVDTGKNFVFTFQYGQIYYVDNTVERSQFMVIYIPIWLDLLCLKERK